MATINDAEEFRVLTSVLSSHIEYKNKAIITLLNPKKEKFKSLSIEDQGLMRWFPDYLAQLQHSIEINDYYFTMLARTVAADWGAALESQWSIATYSDNDKVKGLMAQYVREWSVLGAQERAESMGRILTICEQLFPNVEVRPNIEVLVPGAGLGRLVVEFVKRGFRTQGNEISYHMLLNSSFVLNNTFCENQYMICPFIHKSSNVTKRNDQLRQVFFPDFKPGDVSLLNNQYPNIDVGELMSMVAGGFEDLYGPPGLSKMSEAYSNDPMATNFRQGNTNRFDVVATCFFLDTCSNIIDYIRTIKNTIKSDGYWVNFGPLLWHFEDNYNVQIEKKQHEDGSWTEIPVPFNGLELSKDDLVQLIKDMGFTFLRHESEIPTTYGGDSSSMGEWRYKAEFWVCQKSQD